MHKEKSIQTILKEFPWKLLESSLTLGVYYYYYLYYTLKIKIIKQNTGFGNQIKLSA